MFLTLVNEYESLLLLSNLSNSTSHDLYGLTNKLIKGSRYEITKPMNIIINTCMQQGKFPDIMKISTGVPIYKSGNENDCTNYRPISIVPSLAKPIEMAFSMRLTDVFNKSIFFKIWFQKETVN